MKNSGRLGQLPYAALLLVVVVLSVLPLRAADKDEKESSELVQGNQRFGIKLLQKLHQANPEHNVVVSPISLTLIFGAIQNSSKDEELRQEIGKAFGWGSHPNLGDQARLLLNDFKKPAPVRRFIVGEPHGTPPTFYMPDGAWISNTLLYRNRGVRSNQRFAVFDSNFVADASKNFGIKFVSTGSSRPSAKDLHHVRTSLGALPQVPTESDFWISSGAHLGTRWSGNTFVESEPFSVEFQLAGGGKRQVEMIESETEFYLHRATESFEAAALRAGIADVIVVLPAPGKNISALANELATSPELLDAVLKEEVGTIVMPMFRVRFETDLRPALVEMGIRRPFEELGAMIKIKPSFLTDVAQKVDFRVDREGIHAEAETVTEGILGGMMGGVPPKPFRMILDRPFLFLVRSSRNNAVMYIGIVMDPSQTP